VGDQTVISFRIPQRTLPWQSIFVGFIHRTEFGGHSVDGVSGTARRAKARFVVHLDGVSGTARRANARFVVHLDGVSGTARRANARFVVHLVSLSSALVSRRSSTTTSYIQQFCSRTVCFVKSWREFYCASHDVRYAQFTPPADTINSTVVSRRRCEL